MHAERSYRRSMTAGRGFTLVELMIVITIIGILIGIAVPNYREYLEKASRTAAQSELLELAAQQEKIYLNSNLFSASVTAAYNGTSSGGLGKTTGKTEDGKYTISVSPNAPGQTFTLTATPVAGSSQVAGGAISVSSNNTRTCDSSASWCPSGRW